MKKITLTIGALAITSLSLFSQDKQFKEIEGKYYLQQFETVKQLVDKAILNPTNENNPEAWVWKSTIDAVIFQNEKLAASCPTCLESSYEAFKKYETLQPDFKLMSQAPFSWKSLGIIYDNYYNKGVTAFKAKDYETSYTSFERCTQMSNIMMSKDLRKNGGALDTIPFLYAGYAAQNAKKIPEAIKCFTLLADRKYAVKEDAELYKLLLSDYIETKDKGNFDKYLAIAQEVFPAEDYQPYKLEFMNRNSNLDDKLALYNAEDAKNALTGEDYINFGSMFSQHSKEEKEMLEKNPAKKAIFDTKAREAFTKAYKLTNNPLMAFNVGLLFYNDYIIADNAQRANIKTLQEINASKPVEKDPKKKAAVEAKYKEQTEPLKKANADLDVKMMDLTNSSIEWLEKFVTSMKDKADKSKIEKSSIKNSVNYLTNLFVYKMDKARGKDVKAYDAADAKVKLYDDMYNKLEK